MKPLTHFAILFGACLAVAGCQHTGGGRQERFKVQSLPESKMQDPQLEAEILEVMNAEQAWRGSVFYSPRLAMDDWEYQRNELSGVIESRWIAAAVPVKDPRGRCRLHYLLFAQSNQGGDKYGKTFYWRESDKQAEKISCEVASGGQPDPRPAGADSAEAQGPSLPEPKMSDPQLEAEVAEILATEGEWKGTTCGKPILAMDDWSYVRNELSGVIESRWIAVAVPMKPPRGRCKLEYLLFAQEAQGADRFSKTFFWRSSGKRPQSIPCELVLPGFPTAP
ncbi:MAG: hypothetical protein ACOX6T_06185 [Myxococcales bacterium]|jgi:hypothetical protein